jgi:alkylation response protein AidB-like acyl-CoA dehydrogenase
MAADCIVTDFDSRLAPAERALIGLAQDFGQRVVAPAARSWEHERRHPTEALRQAFDEGLARIELSPAWGGHGLRFSTTLRVVEELARHDFGFAFSLVNHHNALVRVSLASRPLAQRLVPLMFGGQLIGAASLTEPNHGSDLARLTTSAKKVEGGWLLNGAKAWICNAAVAGVFTTLAQTIPGSGWQGLGTFLVEAQGDGFEREAPYELHGAQAIGVGGFRLENYFAPDEALLEPPGTGFKASLGSINRARAYVAAMCAGMLDSAISHAVRYATGRHAFGQKVIDFQGLRWSLVDADTDLAALRLLAYRAADQIDAGQES